MKQELCSLLVLCLRLFSHLNITPHLSCVSQLNRSNCHSEKHRTGPKHAKTATPSQPTFMHAVCNLREFAIDSDFIQHISDLGVICIVQRYWQCSTTC